MSKKYFLSILISHLIVLVSVFFPILNISNTSSSIDYYNIFSYIRKNPSTYATVLLIIFIVFELAGVANAVYGLIKKDTNHKHILATFLLGFSSAILGAMYISVGSHIFFLICAISFFAISYSSIKLMKLEN